MTMINRLIVTPLAPFQGQRAKLAHVPLRGCDNVATQVVSSRDPSAILEGAKQAEGQLAKQS
jgi:hypothetical protein